MATIAHPTALSHQASAGLVDRIPASDLRPLAGLIAGSPLTDLPRLASPDAQAILEAVIAAGGDRRAAFKAYLARTYPSGDADDLWAAVSRIDPAAPEPADDPRGEPRRVLTLADLAGMLSATEWLWPAWLALGYVTLLVGLPGTGKSAVALYLAGCLLRGWPWPDRTRPDHQSETVLWLDTEASQALLLERVTAWGLPADRILVPSLDPEGNPLGGLRLDTDEGFAEVERVVRDRRPRLMVVDSLRGAHQGDENSSDLNTLLIRLAALARDERIAVLVLHHLRKAGQFENLQDVGIDRVRGSTAITAMARSVLAIDQPDPLQPDAWRLKVIKSNLARTPEPVGFTVTEQGPAFGRAPAAPQKVTERERASDFLVAFLQDGPKPAGDAERAAAESGISQKTLQRAKSALGVRAAKAGGGGWSWSLPGTDGAE